VTSVRPRPRSTRPPRAIVDAEREAKGLNRAFHAAVAEVRERTDLVALVGESVPLRPNRHNKGRTYIGRCPSHEATGLHVDPASDPPHYACFECEGISGDAFDWVILMKGGEFDDALRMLAKRVRVRVPPTAFPAVLPRPPKPPPWAAWVAAIRNLDVRVAMFEALHERDFARRLGADRGPPIAKVVFLNGEATVRTVKRELAAGRVPLQKAVDTLLMFIAASERSEEGQRLGKRLVVRRAAEGARR